MTIKNIFYFLSGENIQLLIEMFIKKREFIFKNFKSIPQDDQIEFLKNFQFITNCLEDLNKNLDIINNGNIFTIEKLQLIKACIDIIKNSTLFLESFIQNKIGEIK